MRNPFKLHVSILDSLNATSSFLREASRYPVDNVIQIKLSKEHFTDLFRDPGMSTSLAVDPAMRYSAPGLLARLSSFFGRGKYHNYNNLAADITTLILNTYSDVDVNPVALEAACQSPNGAIYSYFIKSRAAAQGAGPAGSTSTSVSGAAENTHEYGASDEIARLKVFELVARELDNMISRNMYSTSEDRDGDGTSDHWTDTSSYDDLDALYTISEAAFWQNLTEGDSIVVEGSFVVPTRLAAKNFGASYDVVGSGNLPVILQFVYAATQTYGFMTPPTFYLLGAASVDHDVSGPAYEDAGFVALDHEDRDVSGLTGVQSSLPATLAGVTLGQPYAIDFSLSVDGYDKSLQRLVTFQDTAGPAVAVDFSAFGAAYNATTKTLTLEGAVGTNYASLLPRGSAVDFWDTTIKSFETNLQGVPYAAVPPNAAFVNPNYTGTTNGTFAYPIVDRQGNSNDVLASTFSIILVDTTPPVMNGSTQISVPRAAAQGYVDAGFSDSFSGVKSYSITADSSQAGQVFTSLSALQQHINAVKPALQADSIIVSYTVLDNANNSTSAQRTLNLV